MAEVVVAAAAASVVAAAAAVAVARRWLSAICGGGGGCVSFCFTSGVIFWEKNERSKKRWLKNKKKQKPSENNIQGTQRL